MARRSAETLVALDTSCLIAILCEWHEHHAPTIALVERRLEEGAILSLAAPALVEAYSVLTRLPAPHRLAPEDALGLLRDNFHSRARTVALTTGGYWSLLAGAPGRGVYGGRTYDAVIVACARRAGASEIITLNARHFQSFADATLRVTSPLSD